MNEQLLSANQRKYSLDMMRVIAISAVIMIHIASDYVKYFSKDTLNFVCGNFFNSISRCAVPVFLMISGALMLDEKKTITAKKMLNSTGNLFGLLVIWCAIYSFAYNIIKPILLGEPIFASEIIKTIINGHYHMWYLFVLIGLYLITPILRLFIKCQNLHIIQYYLIFSSILCFCAPFINYFLNLIIPQENLLIGYISKYRIDYVNEYLVYYILGWYFLNINIKRIARIRIYILGLLGLAITFLCTQIFYDNTVEANCFFIPTIA